MSAGSGDASPGPPGAASSGPAPRARLIGRRLERHARIGSTNDRARELADTGEEEGTVVLADEQLSGRGRAGRGWHSAPGLGVYLSVVLRPPTEASRAPMLGLLAAVAGACALECRIKWPNDLMLDGLKVGGVLAEARTTAESIRDAVVGIGVNVNHDEGDFPPELRGRATSLRRHRGAPQDRAGVVRALIDSLDDWYAIWRRVGDRPVLERFASLAPDLRGRRVRVQDAGAPWTGVTEGLGPAGELLVRRDGSGRRAAVRFGEIVLVEEV